MLRQLHTFLRTLLMDRKKLSFINKPSMILDFNLINLALKPNTLLSQVLVFLNSRSGPPLVTMERIRVEVLTHFPTLL